MSKKYIEMQKKHCGSYHESLCNPGDAFMRKHLSFLRLKCSCIMGASASSDALEGQHYLLLCILEIFSLNFMILLKFYKKHMFGNLFFLSQRNFK